MAATKRRATGWTFSQFLLANHPTLKQIFSANRGTGQRLFKAKLVLKTAVLVLH
jgi:hypothetical protein